MRKICCLLSTGGLLVLAALLATQAAAKDPSLFAPPTDLGTAAKKGTAATRPSDAPPAPQTSRATRPASATASEHRIVKIDVTVGPDGDLAAAYDKFFTQHVVHPRAVRDKVRLLLARAKTNPQRHEEIIALLEAALRNGQSQPWMYEALTLSMEVAKRPAAEVERVLMSAADFTTNPNEMMYLAQYMARLGHEQRAMQLFRQASTLSPLRTEPYAYGLDLARRLDDPEAIRWAALGVLRQAWPREKAELQQTARYAAAAAIEKLRTTGHTAEADSFAAALAEALSRDVVVRVSWEGEADVDLMVQEPGGTVCSLRDRRTTGGGVLIGDSDTQPSPSTSGGASETYVCPEGFSGTYKLLLRLVWGRIPAGKVTVEITTRNAGGRTQQVRQQIPLSDRNSLVSFDVANGRRHESLELQQVAIDTEQQLAVNRAVLAQQISSINDQIQTPFVTSFTPVAGPRGNVGFQPVITILPSGVTMSANAVISADRRYVRITALPFFSSVGAIGSFTIAQPTEQVGF